MYITVQDALQLKRFKKFDLLAGANGLDRKIEKMCLLDYEVVNQIEDQFFKNEFALSSLLGAKDNKLLILKSVEYLVNSGVSGLAIKNIYYKELPDEVIKYANENNFPVFMFDNSVFFEDIITDVRDVIRDLENGKQLEYKLDSLLRNYSTENHNIELFYEIAGFTNLPYQVLCITEREKQGKSQFLSILESFRNIKIGAVKGLIKYYDGIIMIYCTEHYNRKLFNVDLSNILIKPDLYHIGSSQFFKNGKNFKEAVQQALWALKIAEIENYSDISYEDIGTYKLIVPFVDNKIFNQYLEDMILPIVEYDKKHSTELLDTLKTFIKHEGNVGKIAEELCQHNNTIRYRISTMKKILDMESAEGSFYEQMAIALKVVKLKGLEF